MHPFTKRRSDSVAALGEQRLIAAIRGWLGTASPPAPFGIGDDCAVIAPARDRQLLTVDPVIYGRHFDDSVPPEAVGAKLLKRNLSDIAAMGGRPTAAVIALTLDPRVSLAWLEGFYRGLAACARRYRVPIVGGDVAEARGALAASLTLLGAVTGKRAVTRNGARWGDLIFVTGKLGGSVRSGHHYTFQPRLAEGAWLAHRPEVVAMMDISDGLAKDLWSLTPKVGRLVPKTPRSTPPTIVPALNPKALPRRRGASLRDALCDGEDYELVVALDRKTDRAAFERAWRRAFPRLPLTCIGRFVHQNDLPPDAIHISDYRGYEHLG